MTSAAAPLTFSLNPPLNTCLLTTTPTHCTITSLATSSTYSHTPSLFTPLLTLPLPTPLAPPISAAMLLETSLLALSSTRTLHIINAATSSTVFSTTFNDTVRGISISRTNAVVLTGPAQGGTETHDTTMVRPDPRGEHTGVKESDEFELHFFSTADMKRTATMAIGSTGRGGMPCSPGGTVTNSKYPPVYTVTPPEQDTTTRLSISRDVEYLAMTTANASPGHVSLYSLAAGLPPALVGSGKLHLSPIACLTLTQGVRNNDNVGLLASCGASGTSVVLTCTPSMTPYGRLTRGATVCRIFNLSFSGSERMVAASGGNGTIHVWKVAKEGGRSFLKVKSGYEVGERYVVAFSEKEGMERVVGVSEKGRAKVWEMGADGTTCVGVGEEDIG